MDLSQANPIGFISTSNAETAREFYEKTLGLSFESDDQFALVFRVGAGRTMLRIASAPEFTPASHTIFGWEVDDIQAMVSSLSAKGIQFLRFDFLKQDDHGVWAAPGGTSVAWFKDPDGNMLSVSQHPVQ
jgi:catechol 2,3-dioxygenase-like lactoylglutathione lyase family enzyme